MTVKSLEPLKKSAFFRLFTARSQWQNSQKNVIIEGEKQEGSHQ